MGIALAMALVVTGCGEDDPITPPTPEPDPTPNPPVVVHEGYECTFTLSNVYGDEEAFLKIVKDTIDFYCPALKEEAPGVYKASITFEKGDTAEYVKLKNDFKSLKSSLLFLPARQSKPVVTSYTSFKTFYKSTTNINSDSDCGLLLPQLVECVWATDDAKESGIESLTFGSVWLASGSKEIFNGSVTINGTDKYEAARQGNTILLFDKDNQVVYGFVISGEGESVYLVKVGKETLAEEKRPVYTFKNKVEK